MAIGGIGATGYPTAGYEIRRTEKKAYYEPKLVFGSYRKSQLQAA